MGQILNLIIFRPPRTSYPNSYVLPSQMLHKIPRIRLDSNNKKHWDFLYGFHIRNDSEFTILYSHANAEDLGNIYKWLKRLSDTWNVNVFAYEYTGYGHHRQVEPSELSICLDIHAAFNYLVNDLKISTDKIILHGRSLGCFPTCDLASRCNPLGVILQSPFHSIKKFSPLVGIVGNPFNNATRVKKIKSPILILHGTVDNIIPMSHSQDLVKIANDCTFQIIHEGNHNDLNSFPIFRASVSNFIAKITGRQTFNNVDQPLTSFSSLPTLNSRHAYQVDKGKLFRHQSFTTHKAISLSPQVIKDQYAIGHSSLTQSMEESATPKTNQNVIGSTSEFISTEKESHKEAKSKSRKLYSYNSLEDKLDYVKHINKPKTEIFVDPDNNVILESESHRKCSQNYSSETFHTISYSSSLSALNEHEKEYQSKIEELVKTSNSQLDEINVKISDVYTSKLNRLNRLSNIQSSTTPPVYEHLLSCSVNLSKYASLESFRDTFIIRKSSETDTLPHSQEHFSQKPTSTTEMHTQLEEDTARSIKPEPSFTISPHPFTPNLINTKLSEGYNSSFYPDSQKEVVEDINTNLPFELLNDIKEFQIKEISKDVDVNNKLLNNTVNRNSFISPAYVNLNILNNEYNNYNYKPLSPSEKVIS